ncbi:MAG: hypothetical protein Q9213_007482 [Squamulea squamosa]
MTDSTGAATSKDTSATASRRNPSSFSGEGPDERIKSQLRQCLSNMKYVGNFASYQTSQVHADPGLHVNGIGNISLPLRGSDAASIFEAAQHTLHARDHESAVEILTRGAQRLAPNSFQLRNPAWQQYVQDVVTVLGKDLGLQDSPAKVKVELHNLLLYKKGDNFKPEVEKRSLSTAQKLPSLVKLTWLGVEASDFRLPSGSHLSSNIDQWSGTLDGHDRYARTKRYARDFAVLGERATRQDILPMGNLVYILDNKYSQTHFLMEDPNLRIGLLKGRDRLLVRYLQDACKLEGFTLLLAQLERRINGAEDASENESDNGFAEHPGDITLRNIKVQADREVVEDVKLSGKEIIQLDPFPIMLSQTTYTNPTVTVLAGTQSTQLTPIIELFVLILMPSSNSLDFKLENLEIFSLVKWIESLIEQVRAQSMEGARDDLVRICEREATTFVTRYGHLEDDVVAKCIDACQMLGDSNLLSKVVQACCQYEKQPEVYTALVMTLRTFDFEEVKPRQAMLYNVHGIQKS